jgi:AraC-like DNA-binding protein
MSPRSLQRRLHSEGTSFAEVLSELRRDLALRYLRDQRIAIAEVGFLLGFLDVSAFHRAFKRWTGSTPAEYQRSLPRFPSSRAARCALCPGSQRPTALRSRTRSLFRSLRVWREGRSPRGHGARSPQHRLGKQRHDHVRRWQLSISLERHSQSHAPSGVRDAGQLHILCPAPDPLLHTCRARLDGAPAQFPRLHDSGDATETDGDIFPAIWCDGSDHLWVHGLQPLRG